MLSSRAKEWVASFPDPTVMTASVRSLCEFIVYALFLIVSQPMSGRVRMEVGLVICRLSYRELHVTLGGRLGP